MLEEMALAGVPLELVQSCVQEAYTPKKGGEIMILAKQSNKNDLITLLLCVL